MNIEVFKQSTDVREVINDIFARCPYEIGEIADENGIDIDFNEDEIKSDKEKKQFKNLRVKGFEGDGYKFSKSVVDIKWLQQRVLNKDGKIADKDFYIQITGDESLDGCLFILDGDKQPYITYLEMLACTGLRQTIIDKVSEFELRCETIKSRYLNCIKFKNGGVIVLQTANIEYYAQMILESRLTQDQYKYYFGKLDGFEYDSSGRLSREIAGKYFLNRWRAKSFGRAKLTNTDVNVLMGKDFTNTRLNAEKEKQINVFKKKYNT